MDHIHQPNRTNTRDGVYRSVDVIGNFYFCLLCIHYAVFACVADLKLFVMDPDPTFQRVLDPDPDPN
jgi:hypothetical protein